MSSAIELNSVFDQAEELVGTSPSGIDLRSAIHAVITKGVDMDERVSFFYRKIGSRKFMDNTEYLARNYETMRTTTQTIG